LAALNVVEAAAAATRSAAVTPSTTAATMDRFCRNLLGIAAFLSLIRGRSQPVAPSPAGKRTARRFPTTVRYGCLHATDPDYLGKTHHLLSQLSTERSARSCTVSPGDTTAGRDHFEPHEKRWPQRIT
jgi:hypothetical protein